MKKENIIMSIFMIVFLLVFLSLHYFVIGNYFDYLSIKKGIYFYSLVVILTLLYPASMVVEKKIVNGYTRYFYLLSSIIIGFIFISFFVILTFKFISLFFYLGRNAGESILAISALLSVYAVINAKFIVLKKIDIPFRGIKKKIKIVQLSDIHIGSINRREYLKEIVKRTNEQNPDMVVITGDLVDGSAPIRYDMVEEINKIKSNVLYIIGNHEIYEGLDKIMPVLKKTKMKILRNEIVKEKGLTFLGLDYSEGNKWVNEKIKEYKFNDKKPAILLYHAPSINVDNLSERNIALHLAGHTHNGQIFPFNLLVKLAFTHIKGMYKSKDGKSYLYVSQGSGTWGPPMRLLSKSEITLINLIPKK